jgi:thiamine kinase-like enzyme
MNINVPRDIVSRFLKYNSISGPVDIEKLATAPIGDGLINHSFKISYRSKPCIFLQEINTNVFKNPADLQSNYIHLWQFAESEFTGLKLPAPLYYSENDTLYLDNEGKYWRSFQFIENSKTRSVVQNAASARSVAKTFGKFTEAYSEFNSTLLKETIPGFHDLSMRYKEFELALSTDRYERMQKAYPMILELQDRKKYVAFYEWMKGSGKFQKRVMHHDAKIGNILFRADNGKVIGPIDLDTAMPGYFISDLGDMIRSMVSSENEASVMFHRLGVRKNFYTAILQGYCSVMGKELTKAEKKYIHAAGLLMIYMQSLRFLGDYLNGDTYYRIQYKEQNFDRAMNQFILLQRLEEFLQEEYSFRI